METQIINLLQRNVGMSQEGFLVELLRVSGSADVEDLLWRTFSVLVRDRSLLPLGSSVEEIASCFDQLIVLAAGGSKDGAMAGVRGEGCHV